jgi:mono/diheme cytochrome c family protein
MTVRLPTVAIFAVVTVLGASSMLHAQGAMRSIWDGVYNSAQADRGKVAYSNSCAKCHGGTLDGNDEIPALKGSHFMADWETQSVADLVGRTHMTMPLDNPGSISIATATDMVAYLLQQNQMPAGSTELPADPGMAGQIRIDAEKPGTGRTQN